MIRIKLGSRFIGDGEPPYFVADIAANHDGKLDRAFKLIELAKEAGANAAKFQNFKASKIVSQKGFSELGSKLSHQAFWKKPVFEIYEDASLSYEWTPKLKEKCSSVGIEYFTSPYDSETVDHVDRYVNVYKIGSGDITWIEVIKYIAHKGKPIMIATGASSMEDVQRAMKVLKKITSAVVLMQCNTNYTVNEENFKYINLSVLKAYKKLFPDIVLGLSDHTYGHATVLGALALGAHVFEKHFTDDNEREGPDHKFAMNPTSWREMVARARELDMALGDGIKRIEKNEQETVFIQRRGLRYIQDVQKGHKINQADIFPLRPFVADSIPPYDIRKVIGKTMGKDAKADTTVRWKDFE